MRQAQQIMDYAANHYATQPEYLWAKFSDYATLRHSNAKGKWYEDWLPGGAKADFAPNAFKRFYKEVGDV